MGWTKEGLYKFASELVGYSTPIESLDQLGNNQLEFLKDRIRYEKTKLGIRSGQSKARRQTKVLTGIAEELLKLILAHPVAEQRGLTEILIDSPLSILQANFIPNTTAAGKIHTAKKSLLRAAIDELSRHDWLLPPETDQNQTVRIYELNSQKSILR